MFRGKIELEGEKRLKIHILRSFGRKGDSVGKRESFWAYSEKAHWDKNVWEEDSSTSEGQHQDL